MAIDDQNFEKQIGCMAGFLQIFDRHHIVSGPKRIPSFSAATGSTSPSERSDFSVRESSDMFPSSPENFTEVTKAATVPSVPVFDFKEGVKNSWKLREAPRLSLDSRLRPRDIRTTAASNNNNTNDSDCDKNRRSPSVVARLMGLDALPNSANREAAAVKQAELRRSASESRASRDLNRFFDESLEDEKIYRFRSPDNLSSELKPTAPIRSKQAASLNHQKKSYFNAVDFFPEPNRTASRPSQVDGEIERRMRRRGISEPAKDLETLKQILEALQLKGLLHSQNTSPKIHQNHRSNLISDRPIVVMKPGPKPPAAPVRPGSVNKTPVRSRSPTSPDPSPRRRPLPNNKAESNRRISAVHSSSAKSSLRKMTPDRNRRPMYSPAEDDTATTISESSASSSSLFDVERRVEYRAGRNLLERCDRLLTSIAAFTAAEQVTDQQPSPVSVLDSSFLEESSPSPVMKRSIQFKDPMSEWDNEEWVPATPATGSLPAYVCESEYPDFAYVSNVLLALERHPNSATDVCLLYLEKRHGTAMSTDAACSKSMLQWRLIFDTVNEILERKRVVSPWKSFKKGGGLSSWGDGGAQLIREVWLEVRRAREGVQAEDLNAVTLVAIQKDMMFGDHGWGDTSVEMSAAVLNIERLVFKDLVVEMIGDLADLAGSKTRNPLPRRKLLF